MKSKSETLGLSCFSRLFWLKCRTSACVLLLPGIVFLAACAMPNQRVQVSATPSPQAAFDALLAADQAFSRASMGTDLVSGLSAMFAADVMMPVPGNRFAVGAAEASQALRSNPDNLKSQIAWKPIRGGISADGQQGFTMGLMTLYKPDKTTTPQKYLAYWMKQKGEQNGEQKSELASSWRVIAYRRVPIVPSVSIAEGAAPTAQMTQLLPAQMLSPAPANANKAALETSLGDAERAFSRDAQIIGIGPAFVKYGSMDAAHLGGRQDAGFITGPDAISRAVAADAPPTGSPVSWAPDRRVIVAASGDLGVTIGIITSNTPDANGMPPASFPFFTVWRRENASAPWRYVAE
jgi:ketosteroid isomerase-like protein